MERKTKRKERIGIVVSDKMNKSRIVKVERSFAHPAYGKIVRKSSKFVAHDEKNETKVGDVVRIVETRPLSKTKHWRIENIIERAK
ncbi:MAG: 30S ribosomal protein S17 [Chitinispirillaceae bacterium]|nr:30S ribosomal protein S17 [Chitinispirillaceae bacterium]